MRTDDEKGDIAQYKARGLNQEFNTEDYKKAFEEGTLLTKQQLIEEDRHCLIKSFEEAVQMTKDYTHHLEAGKVA